MPNPAKVAVLVGSLRRESFTRKLVLALADVARPELELTIVSIGDLPLYNQDLDTDSPPAAWTTFRDAVRPADGLLFATPEYNRSVPGVLKNAIDVGSRPYGKSVFDRKPGGVISVSPGAIGGYGANHHLRQSLVFLNVPTMQQPEAYVGGADKLVGADGKFANDSIREFMTKYAKALAAWIERNPAR